MNSMKRFGVVLVIFLSMILMSCDGETVQDPTITNGSFEDGATAPDDWREDPYYTDGRTAFEWEPATGRGNSKCVSVTSTKPNMAGWVQDTIVVPEVKAYNVSGYIKGQGIEGGKGAHLCLEGTWFNTIGLLGTFDWTQVVFTFLSDGLTSPKIGCRLGYWSMDSIGQAWFDDLVIENDFTQWRTPYFNIYLEETDASVMTTSTRDRWLSHLNAYYESLHELTDHIPFDGGDIRVLSVRQYPGGWAVAGNPIQWYYPYVNSNIQHAHAEDDWIFGILHEISHDFDVFVSNGVELNPWTFDAEHSANFKLYYAVSSLNGKVFMNGSQYIGNQLKEFYLSRYTELCQQYETTGSLSGFSDCITYRFVVLAEKWGWASVRKTIIDIGALAAANPSAFLANYPNRVSKFNLFLDTWSENAGSSVRDDIGPEELDRFVRFLNP